MAGKSKLREVFITINGRPTEEALKRLAKEIIKTYLPKVREELKNDKKSAE